MLGLNELMDTENKTLNLGLDGQKTHVCLLSLHIQKNNHNILLTSGNLITSFIVKVAFQLQEQGQPC